MLQFDANTHAHTNIDASVNGPLDLAELPIMKNSNTCVDYEMRFYITECLGFETTLSFSYNFKKMMNICLPNLCERPMG